MSSSPMPYSLDWTWLLLLPPQTPFWVFTTCHTFWDMSNLTKNNTHLFSHTDMMVVGQWAWASFPLPSCLSPTHYLHPYHPWLPPYTHAHMQLYTCCLPTPSYPPPPLPFPGLLCILGRHGTAVGRTRAAAAAAAVLDKTDLFACLSPLRAPLLNLNLLHSGRRRAYHLPTNTLLPRVRSFMAWFCAGLPHCPPGLQQTCGHFSIR